MITECDQRLRARLAVRLAARVRRQDRPGQGGEQHVVLARPAGRPSRRSARSRDRSSGVMPRFCAEVVAEVDVVHRDAVLEQARVDEVPQRLHEVARLPRLVLVDAHDAVAEVVVLAEDVGEGVVLHVVRALPLRRRRGVVPLPGAWSGSSGRASSPTGRAARCARSPCCRAPSPRPGSAVPSTQADLYLLPSSSTRPAISSLRWTSMTRRMYAASRAPRSSRTDCRMTSSSRPDRLDVRRRQVGDRAEGIVLDVPSSVERTRLT